MLYPSVWVTGFSKPSLRSALDLNCINISSPLPPPFLKSFAHQILLVFSVVLLPEHDVAIVLQEPDQVGSHCTSCSAGKRKQFGAGTVNVKERATPGWGEKQAWGNEHTGIYVILCWSWKVISSASACPAVIASWICLLKSEHVLNTTGLEEFPLFFLELLPETLHCSSSAVIRPAQQATIIKCLVQSHAEYQQKMLSQPRYVQTNHMLWRAFCS